MDHVDVPRVDPGPDYQLVVAEHDIEQRRPRGDDAAGGVDLEIDHGAVLDGKNGGAAQDVFGRVDTFGQVE